MKRSILSRSVLFLSMVLLGFTLYAQNINLTGKVTDSSGEPVIGASVVLVGNSTVGVITVMDKNPNLVQNPGW